MHSVFVMIAMFGLGALLAGVFTVGLQPKRTPEQEEIYQNFLKSLDDD